MRIREERRGWPKKYQLETNEYDNIPAGQVPWKHWIWLDEAGISARKPSHRVALENSRVYTYEVFRGFKGSGRRWSAVTCRIIHRDQLPLFSRLVARAEKDAAKLREQAKRRRKTKAYRAEARQGKAHAETVEAERQARRAELDTLCESVGLPADAVGRLLASRLSDVREAHPGWLATAYDALAYSLRHGGIMSSEQAQEEHFYDSLCLAIAAHRRHTETDYDDLLRAGIPREDARASVLE